MGKQAKPKKAAAAAAESPADPEYMNPNLEWHNEVITALDTLKGQYGQDLESRPALVSGGYQNAIMVELMEKRLSAESWPDQILVAGGVNVLWDSPLSSLTPNVKVNKVAIEKFIANTWADGPKPLSEPVDFVATPGNSGQRTRLSPEEPVQALVIHVARRISSGASKQELDQWLRTILSCNGRFIRAESWTEQYFWAVNLRRRTRDAARTTTHLAAQVAADIWLFKKRQEAFHSKTFTYADIAAMYAQHMKDANDDEEPRSDPKLVEKAVTVYERILGNPELRELIARCDRYGEASPWNSISKLLDVMYRCKNMGRMLWVFQLVDLALSQEVLEPGELTSKKLKGTSGSPGMLDLILCKKGMRDFFCGRFLDTRNFPADFKSLMRDAFATPETYRTKFQAGSPRFI